VTLSLNNKTIYLNVDMIGSISNEGIGSKIGHLTHNNAGFKVIETADEIFKLINECNPI
jgi:hypothetical protein